MEVNELDTKIIKHFSKKRNYRFYSWFKKCIDKICNGGRGAVNLCRFVGGKCLINKNVANKKDIEFISEFCNNNNIVIEFVTIDFYKNDL